jgi:hypothetical protein
MFRSALFSALWQRTFVAVVGMKVIVHVAAEVGRSVKPPSRANKDAAVEPLGTIVPVGGAVVGGNVVISIRAGRLRPYFDRDLSLDFRAGCEKQASGKNEQP